MNNRTKNLLNAIKDKKQQDKAKIEKIKSEYKDKEKIKKLTDKERLERIEEVLGIK